MNTTAAAAGRRIWQRRSGAPLVRPIQKTPPSLRWRFALVVFWGLIPALLAAQWTVVRYREDVLDKKQETLASIADLAAVGFHGLVVQLETLLLSLAQTPAVSAGAGDACVSLLATVRERALEIEDIGVIGLDGVRRCDARRRYGALSEPDAVEYFRRAVQLRQLVAGTYRNAAGGEATLLGFAYPMIDAAGAVRGVIYGELNLHSMRDLGNSLNLPSDVALAVVDRNATVLASTAPQAIPVGQPADARLQASSLASAAAEGKEAWSVARSDVAGLPQGDLSVVVESPRAQQLAEAYAQMRGRLAALTLAVPLFVAFVWFRSRRHVFLPLEQLASTAQRIAAGDLDARAAPMASSQELAALGAAMNCMAESQACRIQQLEAAESHYRELFEKRTRELELSNRELEAFSYSVSHDLRAPLHTIEGFSQALQRHSHDGLDEKGRHYLQRITANARTMAGLIEHLLTLARVTRTQFEQQAVDLSAIARKVVDALRESEPERQVDVVIADRLLTRGSPELLELAVTNLLQNAWKYTSSQARAHIVFAETATASGTAFMVRDDGVGFDMRYAGRLFAPFQRLHAQNEFPGTGVGLAIVKRVMQRHHGDIWVQAAPGEGAAFYFSLWTHEA